MTSPLLFSYETQPKRQSVSDPVVSCECLWFFFFFFGGGGCSWNISNYCYLMSTVVPWVHFGVLVSQEVIVWVVKHLMSVSPARGGYGHHLSHIHRLSAHLRAVSHYLWMS